MKAKYYTHIRICRYDGMDECIYTDGHEMIRGIYLLDHYALATLRFERFDP